MRIYPGTTVDYEFKTLGDLGHTGSLNDRQFKFLRAAGYTNALPDMFKVYVAGGGGGGTAAVLSGLAYSSDLISVTTDTASGTIYYLLHNSVTPMTAADIKADVLDLSAVGGGTLDPLETDNQPVDWTGVTPGTYWINMVQDTGVFSNVVSLEVTIVAAAFDPASLPGAAIVVDVSDITTLWQDAGGVTQVTASGQRVGSVTNRGSLGGLFDTSNTNQKPLYTVASGRSYLTADGSLNRERLRLDLGASPALDLSGGYFLWVLFNDTAGSPGAPRRGVFSMAAAGSNAYNQDNGFVMHNTDFSTDTCAVRIWAGQDNSAGVQTQLEDRRTSNMAWGIAEFECIPTASSPNTWLRVEKAADGGVPVDIGNYGTTGSSGYPDLATSVKLFNMFADNNGGSGAPNGFSSCDIAAVVLVTGALSTADRDDVRAWLRTRGAF